MDNKGEGIRFVKGKYAGKTGWLDTSKPKHTTMMYNVIVAISEEEDLSSRVQKTSVRLIANETTPTSLEAAVIHQHEDVEAAMDKLADLLAQCSVQPGSHALHTIFEEKLQQAWFTQTTKGNKATWRMTEFTAAALPFAPTTSQDEV
jgi:hypothetical protein